MAAKLLRPFLGGTFDIVIGGDSYCFPPRCCIFVDAMPSFGKEGMNINNTIAQKNRKSNNFPGFFEIFAVLPELLAD